jgi:6-phosphogluconolactonase
MIDLVVLDDADRLAAAAATRLADEVRRAVARQGRFAMAVSGGSTPDLMFAALATQPVPWEVVHLFQVDERVAPDGHPDRNLTHLRRQLVDRVPLSARNVHALPVTAGDPADAALRYAGMLADVCPDGLDLVHLGLGDDGHTASWPPGDPVVDSDDDVAVVGPYRGHLRLTLTPRVVNRAGLVLWLVSGEAKAAALAGLLAGDPALPASRVRRDAAIVLADRAAAPR